MEYLLNVEGLRLFLSLLSRMSSPIQGIVRPIWSQPPAVLMEELKTTNVQPLVLVDVQPKHTQIVDKLTTLSGFSPRRLLLVGVGIALPPEVPTIATRINTFDLNDLMTLPWEVFGATLVRKHMRGEQEAPQ